MYAFDWHVVRLVMVLAVLCAFTLFGIVAAFLQQRNSRRADTRVDGEQVWMTRVADAACTSGPSMQPRRSEPDRDSYLDQHAA